MSIHLTCDAGGKCVCVCMYAFLVMLCSFGKMKMDVMRFIWIGIARTPRSHKKWQRESKGKKASRGWWVAAVFTHIRLCVVDYVSYTAVSNTTSRWTNCHNKPGHLVQHRRRYSQSIAFIIIIIAIMFRSMFGQMHGELIMCEWQPIGTHKHNSVPRVLHAEPAYLYWAQHIFAPNRILTHFQCADARCAQQKAKIEKWIFFFILKNGLCWHTAEMECCEFDAERRMDRSYRRTNYVLRVHRVHRDESVRSAVLLVFFFFFFSWVDCQPYPYVDGMVCATLLCYHQLQHIAFCLVFPFPLKVGHCECATMDFVRPHARSDTSVDSLGNIR